MNAGGGYLKLRPGASLFDSAEAFAMLRGGHVDVSVLGAYQVSERGDLAKWKRPGIATPGIGGAADISVGAKQVWVTMEHVTNDGQPRILRTCTYYSPRGSRVFTPIWP